MRNIITISREFGAGGGQIGRAVAERLGFYYCDKDVIIRSAMESSKLAPDDFRVYDEKVPFSFGFGQSLFDFYNRPLNEELFKAQKEAIIKVGEGRNCVIVGRNANVVLGDFDHSLHVFISASQYFRIQNLRKLMPDQTDDKILEKMKSVDRTRKKYCSFYTNTEFGNARYYDLALKSSSLGIDACVDIICTVAGGGQ
ncbi:MAG: cytidylate kinase-like family protein [Lachnospiraceae bacterium]|nr:cytidylate kinase-like family protein [Lachnospiraceae bacterium]